MQLCQQHSQPGYFQSQKKLLHFSWLVGLSCLVWDGLLVQDAVLYSYWAVGQKENITGCIAFRMEEPYTSTTRRVMCGTHSSRATRLLLEAQYFWIPGTQTWFTHDSLGSSKTETSILKWHGSLHQNSKQMQVTEISMIQIWGCCCYVMLWSPQLSEFSGQPESSEAWLGHWNTEIASFLPKADSSIFWCSEPEVTGCLFDGNAFLLHVPLAGIWIGLWADALC